MKTSRRRQLRKPTLTLLASFVAFALLAASCGSSDDDASTGDTGTGDASADSSNTGDSSTDRISGTLEVTGSSTVEPITNLLAESFGAQQPSVAISVAGPGSGDGHRAACAGQAPIWNSSRKIREAEIECMTEAGIEFVELRVGIDGISVITSIENDTIGCMNFADLYSLVGIESTGFANWTDANALNAELGGTGPFTGGTLDIFAPGEESGTFDSFIEIVLEDVWEARAEQGLADEDFAVRPDYQAAANDNVIIDGIAGNQHSLGWVGFAFADANRDRIKLLEIDGGQGCVLPTEATIAAAEFPISRFLYTYVDIARAEEPAVSAFIDYMLSDEGQEFVVEAGYVKVADADLEKSRSNWSNRTAGSNF